ncbi:MAG: hypothetical protein QMD04_00505 [Anaerolineales bacterium]|nr:hypothetical protein [Anaerolineales bacterium]
MINKNRLRLVRTILIFFMLALAASGLTAIPLRWELGLLDRLAGPGSALGARMPGLGEWIGRVNAGVQNGYGQYPFLAYGTDWLAFGHIVIAISFLGAIKDPVRNRWIIEYGMIACVLIIPWALVFGAVRGIPPLWGLADIAFGIFGIIPLWLARRETLRLEKSL